MGDIVFLLAHVEGPTTIDAPDIGQVVHVDMAL